MERTKNTEAKLRWQKVGGGSLRIGRKIIKPGERFVASIDEIPAAFRDLVMPLDKIVEDNPETSKPPVVAKTEYSIAVTDAPEGTPKTSTTKYYNVVDGKGKVLNEIPLTETKAKKLVNDLSL